MEAVFKFVSKNIISPSKSISFSSLVALDSVIKTLEDKQFAQVVDKAFEILLHIFRGNNEGVKQIGTYIYSRICYNQYK